MIELKTKVSRGNMYRVRPKHLPCPLTAEEAEEESKRIQDDPMDCAGDLRLPARSISRKVPEGAMCIVLRRATREDRNALGLRQGMWEVAFYLEDGNLVRGFARTSDLY
jgi:hypothetical protein